MRKKPSIKNRFVDDSSGKWEFVCLFFVHSFDRYCDELIERKKIGTIACAKRHKHAYMSVELIAVKPYVNGEILSIYSTDKIMEY